MNPFRVLSVFIIMCLVLAFGSPAPAAEKPVSQPDIVIKISRLNQAVTLIDKIAADMEPPASSPSFFLRSFLFGTDWIDPARSIVIGIHFNRMQADEKPVMAAVIPFIRQNEDFQISYNAVAKMDHYLLSLPPGQGGAVPEAMADELAAASRTLGDGILSMEMAASQMLGKADQQIQNWLATIDQRLKAQPEAAGNLSSDELRQMFNGLIQLGKQIQIFSLGADINQSDLSFFSNVTALDKTDLSTLFSRKAGPDIRRTGKYPPPAPYQFNVRQL